MGQKIEFNPDEWDFQEENTTLQETLGIATSKIIVNELKRHEMDSELLSFYEDSTAQQQKLSATLQASPANRGEPQAKPNESSKQNLEGKKIYISRSHSGKALSQQQEDAFRKQIEDLFELLELEKENDEDRGIRVYQTDSSPSKPWRFH